MAELDRARRFLELLEPEGQFTFQTFAERPDAGGRKARPSVRHGTFDQFATELEACNECGAGVFVMVNRGDGEIHPRAKSCRTAANVTEIRALFVDLDGAPILPVIDSGAPPHWVVQSSPGRWHAYWRVSGCSLDAFSGIQLALADKFDGDVAVKDLPRVMRVPGFIHWKAVPFVSQLYLPAEYDNLKNCNHE